MKKTLIRFSLLTLASCAAMAQTTSPVVQSVQKAIEGNPEVAAKFNAFRASYDEIDVASGAWKPHLDASAQGARALDQQLVRASKVLAQHQVIFLRPLARLAAPRR